MQRPRACAKPAANAAVCPKLRRNRITRTRGVRRLEPRQQLEPLVRAAVVDGDDLVRAPARLERRT